MTTHQKAFTFVELLVLVAVLSLGSACTTTTSSRWCFENPPAASPAAGKTITDFWPTVQ